MKRMVLRRASVRKPAILTATSIVLTCLAAVAGPAQAGGFTRSASIGTGSGPGGVVITSSDSWQTILSIVISQSHDHTCQAVGSLDAINPGGNHTTQLYLFTISGSANPAVDANGVERRIEIRDQDNVNDPNVWPVSTNSAFALNGGATHTIRLLGRKVAGSPNITVDDAYLSILCIDENVP